MTLQLLRPLFVQSVKGAVKPCWTGHMIYCANNWNKLPFAYENYKYH